MKLAEILCRQEYGGVGRDWCVHIGGRILQIDKKHGSLALAGRRIQLAIRADLTIHMTYKKATLIWRGVPQRPAKALDKYTQSALQKATASRSQSPLAAGYVKGVPGGRCRRRNQARSAPGRFAALTAPTLHRLDFAPPMG